jgi:plastocyanin
MFEKGWRGLSSRKSMKDTVVMAVTILAMLALAGLTTGCWPFEDPCDQTVHIVAGQGAKGAVPGTIHVSAGQTICWKNEDTQAHTIDFTDSPGKNPGASEQLVIQPGKTKKIKIHAQKPAGGYGYDVIPTASGSDTPPGEPQVVVD